MKPRRDEVSSVVDLLSQDWSSVEELAVSIITTLDTARAERTSYIGVLEFGPDPWYMGFGPYPGRKSAQNAVLRHPGRSEAVGWAVVPVTTSQGLQTALERLDRPVRHKAL